MLTWPVYGGEDGSCTLAVDKESEARWCLDAGSWADGDGRHDPPLVQVKNNNNHHNTSSSMKRTAVTV